MHGPYRPARTWSDKRLGTRERASESLAFPLIVSPSWYWFSLSAFGRCPDDISGQSNRLAATAFCLFTVKASRFNAWPEILCVATLQSPVYGVPHHLPAVPISFRIEPTRLANSCPTNRCLTLSSSGSGVTPIQLTYLIDLTYIINWDGLKTIDVCWVVVYSVRYYENLYFTTIGSL